MATATSPPGSAAPRQAGARDLAGYRLEAFPDPRFPAAAEESAPASGQESCPAAGIAPGAPDSSVIGSLLRAYQRGQRAPAEVVEEYLRRLGSRGTELGAVVRLLPETAAADARESARRYERGHARPLEGIPFAVKDNIQVEGSPTEFGSPKFAGFQPATTARAVHALRAAGAILIAKLATYEFACGPNAKTANPWSPQRMSGGSSSGSAAAVGAGLVPIALGTDTGGSVRVPASWCGAVGMKPTFGRISRQGIAPLSWTLDHVGVITASVPDNARVLEAIAGYDPADPYSADAPYRDTLGQLGQDLSGVRVGVLTGWFATYSQPDVVMAMDLAAGRLREHGAELVAIDVPELDVIDPDAIKHVLTAAELASVRADGADGGDPGTGYGPAVSARISAGQELSAVDYLHALRLRADLAGRVREAARETDVLLSATCPVTALPVGATHADIHGTPHPVSRVLARHTSVFNISRQPALTVPVGLDHAGLPIGVQVASALWREDLCYWIGSLLHEAWSSALSGYTSGQGQGQGQGER
jgi:aspartyl-tRNA(Asn)/glutamyl-tRNA(Gln) amidotransferase subunit A